MLQGGGGGGGGAITPASLANIDMLLSPYSSLTIPLPGTSSSSNTDYDKLMEFFRGGG